MHYLRKRGLTIVLLLALLGFGVPAAGLAASRPGCAPVWYIGARGSGEPARGHYGLGRELDDMASVISDDLAAKGLRLAHLADTYNADSVSDLKPNSIVLNDLRNDQPVAAAAEYIHTSVDRYDASIQAGIKNAEYAVRTVLADCPAARIIMAGYSQGAIAVHDAENYLASNRPGEFSHIVGTLLLGDPDRVADTKARRFGTSLSRAEGLRVYLKLVRATDVPAPAATANIANADDIVGDFALNHLLHYRAAAQVHESYATTAAGRRLLSSAANWVASLALRSVWAVRAAPLPPNASEPGTWTTISAVSCPKPSWCVVAGTYRTNVAAKSRPLLLTGSGKSWTAAQGPLPAGGSDTSDVTSISCPAVAECVATGDYYDASADYREMLLVDHSGTWRAIKAPSPPDAGTFSNESLNPQLTAITCPSPSYCVGVGSYLNKSGVREAYLLVGSGMKWQAIKAPQPANADPLQDSWLNAVSCSPGLVATPCAAVGNYWGGAQPLLVTGSGTSWKARQAPLPSNAFNTRRQGTPVGLDSVACPAAGHCVAVGSYHKKTISSPLSPFILTQSGTTWRAMEAPVQAGTDGSHSVILQSVTCYNASSCTAVGAYHDTFGYIRGLIETGHAAAWKPASTAPLSLGALPPAAPFSSVIICSGLAACVGAIDQYLLVQSSASSWTAQLVPVPPDSDSPAGAINAVACPTTLECLAVGQYWTKVGKGGLLLTQMPH